jgi:RNA polymerase sigma-70 factor, ECF subfamily
MSWILAPGCTVLSRTGVYMLENVGTAKRDGMHPPDECRESIDDSEERALAARAVSDRAAFALLYRRYVDLVFRYCLAHVGDRATAEDLTAETFLRALAHIAGFRGERSFRSWLFAIAHNTVANAHRSRSRRPETALEEDEQTIDPSPTPEESYEQAEARREVHRLLAALPDDQRRILELRLAGLSGAEIADVLGRSPGAVKIAQVRAFARLRDLMGIQPATENAKERTRAFH